MFLSDATFEASTITMAQQLCQELKESLKRFRKQSHERSMLNLTVKNDLDQIKYHQQKIVEIEAELFAEYYTLEEGRKYYKVWKMESNGRSIVCFIEKSSGNIYKAASTKAPAKGIRFNIHSDWEEIKKRVDPFGSWLYLR